MRRMRRVVAKVRNITLTVETDCPLHSIKSLTAEERRALEDQDDIETEEADHETR